MRVWIDASSAVAGAGLEALIEGRVDLVDAPWRADVILRDGFGETPARPGPPIVVVSDEPPDLRQLRGGVHAVLSVDAGPTQIVAALQAAAAGLYVIPAGTAQLVSPQVSESQIEHLTPREMETLEMLAEGISNKQIAARLNISEHTAKFHVNSILNKLGAGTRTEAVIRGLRVGLLKV